METNLDGNLAAGVREERRSVPTRAEEALDGGVHGSLLLPIGVSRRRSLSGCSARGEPPLPTDSTHSEPMRAARVCREVRAGSNAVAAGNPWSRLGWTPGGESAA